MACSKARVLNIVTDSMACMFFRGRMAFMNERGFETALCSAPGERLHLVAAENGSEAFEVPLAREIRPLSDAMSLLRLCRLISRYRPTIVNASTPKAGLLGMLAARLAGVPIRVYLLRGLRLETASGMKRLVLSVSERLAIACATEVVCVSESLRQVCIEKGLFSVEKARVLGAGSSNGVDSDHYRVTETTTREGREVRDRLGIPVDTALIGFVGRLTRDKGIHHLTRAFEQVLQHAPKTRLLLVGDFEKGDPVPFDCEQTLIGHPQVVRVPFVADPRPYYAAMDILAFPSLREGFPNVPLEAGAMELPIVAFQATGVVDAVRHGITGMVVPKDDSDAFADALTRYVKEPELRHEHGQAGRRRIEENFQRRFVWEAWADLYDELLRNQRLLPPDAKTCETEASREVAAQ